MCLVAISSDLTKQLFQLNKFVITRLLDYEQRIKSDKTVRKTLLLSLKVQDGPSGQLFMSEALYVQILGHYSLSYHYVPPGRAWSRGRMHQSFPVLFQSMVVLRLQNPGFVDPDIMVTCKQWNSTLQKSAESQPVLSCPRTSLLLNLEKAFLTQTHFMLFSWERQFALFMEKKSSIQSLKISLFMLKFLVKPPAQRLVPSFYSVFK